MNKTEDMANEAVIDAATSAAQTAFVQSTKTKWVDKWVAVALDIEGNLICAGVGSSAADASAALEAELVEIFTEMNEEEPCASYEDWRDNWYDIKEPTKARELVGY